MFGEIEFWPVEDGSGKNVTGVVIQRRGVRKVTNEKSRCE